MQKIDNWMAAANKPARCPTWPAQPSAPPGYVQFWRCTRKTMLGVAVCSRKLNSELRVNHCRTQFEYSNGSHLGQPLPLPSIHLSSVCEVQLVGQQQQHHTVTRLLLGQQVRTHTLISVENRRLNEKTCPQWGKLWPHLNQRDTKITPCRETPGGILVTLLCHLHACVFKLGQTALHVFSPTKTCPPAHLHGVHPSPHRGEGGGLSQVVHGQDAVGFAVVLLSDAVKPGWW